MAGRITKVQSTDKIVDVKSGYFDPRMVRVWNDMMAYIEDIASKTSEAVDDLTKGASAEDAMKKANAAYNLADLAKHSAEENFKTLFDHITKLYRDLFDLQGDNSTQDPFNEIMVLEECLTLLESDLAALTTRVEVIETEQIVQNNHLGAIDAEQIVQNTHLGAIDAEQIVQNTKLANHLGRIETLEEEPRLTTKLDGTAITTPTYGVNYTGNLVDVTETGTNQVEVNIKMPTVLDGGLF